MSSYAYDVVGIGNAIVDILIPIGDYFLEGENLSKGRMSLVELSRSEVLLEKALAYLKSSNTRPLQRSGGSAANTLAGLSSLGGKGAYLGRIGPDPLGGLFRRDMESLNIKALLSKRITSSQTGRCLVFITPDSQRTMETYLGAANDFCIEDIVPKIIQKSKILYLEGYLWDPPHAKEAFIVAAQIARSYQRQVALSLSDAFCVSRHRDSFKSFISSYVDIIFGNEKEILSLTEKNNLEEALFCLSAYEDTLFAITLGEKGSVIYKSTTQDFIRIDPIETFVVDTTGAGDLYASGFLFGLAHGFPLKVCGQIASQCASYIINCLGGRPIKSLNEVCNINTYYG